MKLTKFAHSCVLVETPNRVGLFDSGDYSWNSGSFDINKLDRLDDILITHEHADHMYLPFIKALLSKFPNVTIITTAAAVAKLQSTGITRAKSVGDENVVHFKADHESMESVTPPPPSNAGMHYLNLFSHPGDSHHFAESKLVLALPITAPWGTTVRAASIIQELKPNYVLPIHDWLWRDEVRTKFYVRLGEYRKSLGVIFLQPADGDALEIG